MKKLRLPIITGPLPRPKSLSMDDYLKFVKQNLQYISDPGVYRKWKKKLAVNVPFRLK